MKYNKRWEICFRKGEKKFNPNQQFWKSLLYFKYKHKYNTQLKFEYYAN